MLGIILALLVLVAVIFVYGVICVFIFIGAVISEKYSRTIAMILFIVGVLIIFLK